MPATHDDRPIGVFDSGIGGLTSVRELFRALPAESVVYFGDTARLPYGAKSRETVTRFSLEIASFLVRQNIKCLLVACNTASSFALDTLSGRLDVPVVGVIQPAAEAPGVAVISRACPLFVPLVEEGWMSHPVTRLVAEEYLKELKQGALESLILGCTHYPLLAPLLAEVMGPGVRLVDSGAEAARAVALLLRERGQLATGAPSHRFFLSDEPRNFARIAESFLGAPLPPVAVVDQTDLPWFERAHPDWVPERS